MKYYFDRVSLNPYRMVMIGLCEHQHHCTEFVCTSSLQFDSSRESIDPSVTLKGGHEYRMKACVLEEVKHIFNVCEKLRAHD